MDNVLKLAALQKLCGFLGHDEGKFYFNLINKEKTDNIHSHSKSYRIFKSLYESGAVAKIKDVKKKKDFISYIPLPPTFLCEPKGDIDQKILGYLEKIYLKNYRSLFLDTYLEFSINYGSRIALFLLKHYMNKYAVIISRGAEYEIYKRHLSLEKFNKVTFFFKKDYAKKTEGKMFAVESHLIGNRRIFIIDGKILGDVLSIPSKNDFERPEKTRYTGYLLSKEIIITTPEKNINYIKQVEEELRRLFNTDF